jgi:hypothetical protein
MNYKNKYYKYKYKYNLLKKKIFLHNNFLIGGMKDDNTNTNKLIIRKDIFNEDEKEECLKSVRYDNNFITNKKFKKFVQLYFHAGDMDDITKYAITPINKMFTKKNSKKKNINSNNIFKNKNYKLSKLYNNYNIESVKNTIYYNFNKFKKGLLVVIKNNKLEVFLPFSNTKYINEFSDYLYFENENKDNLKKISTYNKKKILTGKEKIDYKNKIYESINNVKNFSKKHKKKLLFNKSKWVANNCIFRNTFPEYEGDKLTSEYKYLLIELLKKKTNIPDVVFFINLRDFPLLKNNLTEPYEDIYDSKNKKMEKKYIFNSYCPILSRSTRDNYADIPIPTEDDIYRISNKLFPDKCKDTYSRNKINKINTLWTNKINKAIFYGSTTGCGITTKDNMRLKAAEIASKNNQYLKVGITNWNKRLKKSMNKPLDIININNFDFKLSKPINHKEKSQYKYILIIDGHVSAFRLSFDLSLGSVLLIVESDNKLWFSHLLKPYVHYIPIKKDLSDIINIIKWCIDNDHKCKEISKNGMNFYNKFLTQKGIFDYMEHILIDISKKKNF